MFGSSGASQVPAQADKVMAVRPPEEDEVQIHFGDDVETFGNVDLFVYGTQEYILHQGEGRVIAPVYAVRKVNIGSKIETTDG